MALTLPSAPLSRQAGEGTRGGRALSTRRLTDYTLPPVG